MELNAEDNVWTLPGYYSLSLRRIKVIFTKVTGEQQLKLGTEKLEPYILIGVHNYPTVVVVGLVRGSPSFWQHNEDEKDRRINRGNFKVGPEWKIRRESLALATMPAVFAGRSSSKT